MVSILFGSISKAMDCGDIKAIEVLSQKGEKAFADELYHLAIPYFDEGLELIGSSYVFDGLIDDTETKLFLAHSMQKDGKIKCCNSQEEYILCPA